MKIKLELDVPEVKIIGQALKVIDPATIFTRKLMQTLAEAVKAQAKETK